MTDEEKMKKLEVYISMGLSSIWEEMKDWVVAGKVTFTKELSEYFAAAQERTEEKMTFYFLASKLIITGSITPDDIKDLTIQKRHEMFKQVFAPLAHIPLSTYETFRRQIHENQNEAVKTLVQSWFTPRDNVFSAIVNCVKHNIL